MNICLPFIIGGLFAYLMYPIKKKLDKKIPCLSILIIIMAIVLLIFLTIKILIPIISKEGIILYNILEKYYNNINSRYNLNFIHKLVSYQNIINGITISINYIINFVITIMSFIYFLCYMDDIKKYISKFKIYNYIKYIHNDINKYISSLVKISIISFFEYTLVFFIIGHKNFLLVGILAGILNMVPYFGGIITIFITILLDPSIIIRISITYLLLGLIDGYLITPFIYGKYNRINPLLGLFSMSVGTIFGICGIIFSIPLIIVIMSTYRYLTINKINITKYFFKQ